MIENILMIIVGFFAIWISCLPAESSSIAPKFLFGVFLIILGVMGIVS